MWKIFGINTRSIDERIRVQHEFANLDITNFLASEMKVDLALIGVAEEIQDTMKVTGFLQYFTLYGSIASLS